MARGIIFPSIPLTPLKATAKLAEDAGYESYWVTESRGNDGFIRALTAANETSKIKVGTGIAYSFSRHPIAAAGSAADLDELSQGRAVIGLGAGTRGMRQRWYDVDWPHPAKQMKEYADIMRACWAASSPPAPVRYSGDSYTIDIARFNRPNLYRKDIPIYSAGLNPAMIRWAAQAFDGIALFPLAFAKPYFDQIVVPNIEIGARRAGKNPKDVKISAWLIVSVSNDPVEAYRMSQHQLAFYFSTGSYGTVADICGFGKEKDRILEIARSNRANPDLEAMADCVTKDMIETITVTGTPDQVRKKILPFEERVDEVVVESGDEASRLGADAIEIARVIIDALAP